MKILILGATGYIGRNLIQRLKETEHSISCGGRNPEKISKLSEKVKPVYADIEKPHSINKIIREERPDIVFHLAALIHNASWTRLRRINVDGTKNVFEACLSGKVNKVVYTSTVSVVNDKTGLPIEENTPFNAATAYGRSKIDAEKIALDYRNKGLNIAILRLGMVYGENEPHILPLFIRLFKNRLFPIFGTGNEKLHLAFIGNVVDVLMLCLSNEKAYDGIYFVVDKETSTIKELADYMAELLQVNHPVHIPKTFAPIFSHLPYVGEKLSFFLQESDKTYNIERLKKNLGYTPRVSTFDGFKNALLQYRI